MANPRPKADLLLVTVTKAESKAVMQVFGATGQVPRTVSIAGRTYRDLGRVNGVRVFHALSQMGAGSPGASQETVRKGIDALRPAAVILVGIAFGVDDHRQAIGDILVSQQLWLYGMERISKDRLIALGDKPRASTWLFDYLSSAALCWNGANVHFGLVLTGEKLVDDIDYRDQLRQFEPKAIGGEMEGAGLYTACEEAKVDWILVKAICDWADGHKGSPDETDRQATAAHNAAGFVLHALQHAPFVPPTTRLVESQPRSGGEGNQVQLVEAGAGSVIANVQQILGGYHEYHIHIDDDAPQLRKQVTSANERRWQGEYERLREDANEGYSYVVQEPLAKLVAEVEAFEAQTAPVDEELKARIYRLAAIVHLPHKTSGDAELCLEFLAKAKPRSAGDDLNLCRVIEGFLVYQRDGAQAALDALENLPGEESLRLRFAINAESGHVEECQRLIESGSVDSTWSQSDVDWARAFLGYYTALGKRQEAEHVVGWLLHESPSADHCRVAGLSLASLAYREKNAFCLTHGVFPNFRMGLDLDDLVDVQLQVQAAELFFDAARLFRQRGCIPDAIQMLTAAIRLGLDRNPIDPNLDARAAELAEVDSTNPLLMELRQHGVDVSARARDPLTFLDLATLLIDPRAEPVYIFHTALAIADTSSRAAEIASLLEQKPERFDVTEEVSAGYVFTVLELWEKSANKARGLAWLELTASTLKLPRLKPLFYAHFHLHWHDLEAAEAWLQQAQAVAPQHPEVWVAAFFVYQELGRQEDELEYAQELYSLLRTRQTTGWYLGVLWKTGDLVTFLQVLEAAGDLSLDERIVRANRAHALIGLDRRLEAVDDLEWLRANNAASPQDLLNLATAYHLSSDLDRAISVLRDCVERYPDDVSAYLYLSEAYLLGGRRGDSFEWALKARRRFPDNPDVYSHLWSTAYPTGQELHPEVAEAFRVFLPGGRFGDQGRVKVFTLDEFLEWARSRAEEKPTPAIQYREGRLSRMMLCVMRNEPMFLAHQQANAAGEGRFVADGRQSQDLARLLEDGPRQVVLDYSALLTLWSLFGAELLAHLSRRFDRVWLPEKLRAIMLGEQEQMAALGQLARYRAQCAVRDALDTWSARVVAHPGVNPEQGWDVTGNHTEVAVALREGLIHLNEHIPPDDPREGVPTIGIAALADVLYQDGEIDSVTANTLKDYVKAPTAEEAMLGRRLRNERAVLADLTSLVTWAMHYQLEPVFGYFRSIHVAQPARERLQAEIRGYEFVADAQAGLSGLRRLLRQGEEDGLVHFATVPDSERVIRHHIEGRGDFGRSTKAPSSIADRPIEWQFDYLDELLGIACRENIPIWTDDYWTRGLRYDKSSPRCSFGTDSFLSLARAHTEDGVSVGADEYHDKYDELVAWRYYFLPINTDHIVWHLQHGREPESGPLARLLQHYRVSLIDFWQLSQEQEGQVGQFGVELLGHYNHQLMKTLLKLSQEGMSSKIGAGLFAALDLGRHAAQRIAGREPLFYSGLLLHMVTGDPADRPDGLDERQGADDVQGFMDWLNSVILESGVAPEVVDEAWYQLIRLPLAMLDSTKDRLNRQVARALVGKVLGVMPTPAVQYVVTTDVGPRLQREFKVQMHEQVYFQFCGDAGGSIEVRIPEDEWNQSLEDALDAYLQNPADATITSGPVTLRLQPVAPGSMFLRTEALPSEVYAKYPDAQGVRGIASLLPMLLSQRPTRRAGVWALGTQALEHHGCATDTWCSLREKLLSAEQACMEAGRELIQHILGNRPVAAQCFAESAKLGHLHIRQLLSLCEPAVVRTWLGMPELDWSSSDDLLAWARQCAEQRDATGVRTHLPSYLERYGRSIFPESGVVCMQSFGLIDVLTSASEKDAVAERLLSLAEGTGSLVLKANVARILCALLRRIGESPESGDLWEAVARRTSTLIIQVLRGRELSGADQIPPGYLEPVVCRWLYHTWVSRASLDERDVHELAYLASVGASVIADALAIDGQINEYVAQMFVEVATRELRTKRMTLGHETQPSGFFRPAWSLHVNYAASCMLHGLLEDGMLPPQIGRDPLLRDALLDSGVGFRREQAFCCPDLPAPSWLDSELVVDVGLASAALIEQPHDSRFEGWAEHDRNRCLFAMAPESAITLAQTVLGSLPSADEAELLQRILWLFEGRSSPTPTWFVLLQSLFAPDVLGRLRESTECYSELTWHLAELLLHPDAMCPPSLMESIRAFVFELPVDGNAGPLVAAKADILSQFLGVGFDFGPVSEWLQMVAANTALDSTSARLAFRPFILRWPLYAEQVREPLFAELMKIAELPAFRNLWEFGRLTRHHDVLMTARS